MKPIFIISGDKGSGKSTFFTDILSLLQSDGYAVNGFVALHNVENDSYLIKNVATNEESLIMQRVGSYEKRPDHFRIFREGEEKGITWIDEVLEQSPDIAVIDEIGGYELQGRLWSKSFSRLVESEIPLIFTVKIRHLDTVLKKWNIDSAIIFDSDDFGDPKKAFEKIKAWAGLTPK